MNENEKDEGLTLRFWLYLALFAFIVLLAAFAVNALAIDMSIGDSRIVYCANCTYAGQIHLNDTLNFTCKDVQSNGTCSIEKDMEGGEQIYNTDGACNVNISCDSASCGRFQDVGYDGKLSVSKSNTSSAVRLNMSIKNYKDEDFFRWSRTIDPDEIITAEYPINFECPHEVITEVSMKTCAAYLDPILGENNPLIYALATAQNNCTNQLTLCQSEAMSIRNDLKDCQVEKTTLTEANNNCHARLAESQNEHTQDIKLKDNEMVQYRQATVGIGWMYGFFAMVLVVIGFVIKSLTGGQEFG